MAVPSDAESTPSAAEIDAIASPRFSNSFRGWNPDEVRVHLVGVAEIVRSLTQRQGELERVLVEAEATARRADLTRLDPDEVSRVLGEETARVLRTARESAAEIEAKATAQAELLARQAADDAATVRAEATADAEHIRADAKEAAAATRAAGEAHLADVQAAGESELASARAQMEADVASEREAARAEAAAEIATARDHAAATRREVDDEAAALRAEVQAEAEAARSELEAEIAQRLATTDEELRVLTEQAMTQVAEAERMRDRVLADLARKRRAARQHLEQLHAGRDRLITAYEVIRATTDEATGELGVVLGDAKRVADDAARRVGSEELPTPEELLAELELARSAGLPIVAPAPVPTESVGVPDDGGAPQGLDRLAETPADEHGVASEDADGGESPGEAVARGSDGEPPATLTIDSTRPSSATAESPVLVPKAVGDPDGPRRADPSKASPAAAGPPDGSPLDDSNRASHRRAARRTKHRHDPLDGAELPDGPMTPVDASADFERVRVVSVEDATTTSRSGPSDPTDPAPATAGDTGSPAVPQGRSASGVDAKADQPSSTARSDASGPTGSSASSSSTPTSEGTPASSTGVATEADDAVSGIFARLRAEADKLAEPTRDREGDAARSSAGHDTATVETMAPESADDATTKPKRARRSEAQQPGTSVGAKSVSSDAPDKARPGASGDADDAAANVSGSAKAGKTAPVSGSAKAGKTTPVSGSAKAEKAEKAAKTSAATGSPQVRPTPRKPSPSKKPSPSGGDEAGSVADRLARVFERRDAAVDEVARRLAKHLKRSLSDQQSALLDELRRRRGTPTADEILGTPESFAAGWEAVIREDLAGAVAAGVALAGDFDPKAAEHVDVDVTTVIEELTGSIGDPLRARLVRALGEGVVGDDDEAGGASDDLELADRIRSCYREWRGARLAASVADACARAFGLGIRAAIPASTGLRWFGGPGDAPCSDCNDNQLAGVVPAGEVFPTGQHVAPAHPGCRCLALPEIL